MVYASRFHRSGKFAEAEAICRRVLEQDSGHAEALYCLALITCQAGNVEQGVALMEKSAKRNAENPFLFADLSDAYRICGRVDDGVRSARRALTLKPNFPEAMVALGGSLEMQGKAEEAGQWLERALKLDPENPYTMLHLGRVLQVQNRHADAANQYQKALNHQPMMWEAHVNLGTALRSIGRPEDALPHYYRALKINPHAAEAYNNLGIALQGLKRYDDAMNAFRDALRLRPDYADGHFNFGNTCRSAGDLDAALYHYYEVIRLNPNDAQAHHNLSMVLYDQGRLDEAIEVCRHGLKLQPDMCEAHIGLGYFLLQAGRANEALMSCQRAMELRPHDAICSRSELATALYLPGWTVDRLFDLHRKYGDVWRQSPALLSRNFAQETGKKKIRVGYVSSDFLDHPVARNLMPLIECRDRERWEIFLYAHVDKPDKVTQRLKGAADGWRSIVDMTDAEAAALIRSDKIDILVLLAGRFDKNRPLIAVYRAAPVQVSLHDPATSGLDEMDYLITDRYLSPRDTQERFTERLIRLPTFYVHAPLTGMPGVNPLSALERGYLTFGSFNNLAKLNEEVIRLWSEILKAIPNARLALKYRNAFSSEGVRERYRGLFERHGVDSERVDLVDVLEGRSGHLSRYGSIDVALDPFPFTGSTTTFEALWMGVPVITLAGEMMVGRWSMAMLKKIGLDEFIATNEDGYVEIAKRMAGNLPYLAEVRKGLRERVAHSPLCDERARTRQLERVYRWMWRKWCAEHDFANQEQAK
jgi:predicted O-linked N-acetylglucosamine transferase (SPINDLY family)